MIISTDMVNSSGIHLKIIEAKTAKDTFALMQNIPKNATIFLDIDDTIIAPISSSFRIHHSKNFIDDMKAHEEDYENIEEILSNWRLQRRIMIIDNDWVDIVNNLKISYPVYGLTKMDSGSFGKISSMEKWREEELRSLGLVFTDNELAQDLKIDAGYDTNPIFYGGILFVGKASKGEAIRLFDEVLSVKFVVLVDDRLDHLQNVEGFCKKKGIGFLGIHFTGAQFLPGTYDSKLSAFQKQYLIEHGKWLEDAEAIALHKIDS
jgi:hypothetical protein